MGSEPRDLSDCCHGDWLGDGLMLVPPMLTDWCNKSVGLGLTDWCNKSVGLGLTDWCNKSVSSSPEDSAKQSRSSLVVKADDDTGSL